MRGTVAKRLRSQARKVAANSPTLKKTFIHGQVICQGYRRIYRDMKVEYLRRSRGM